MNKPSQYLRLALLQLKRFRNREENLEVVTRKIEAVMEDQKPRLICLSENFTRSSGFHRDPENVRDGYCFQRLPELARKHEVYIVGGTIPEKGQNDEVYGACTVWDPKGRLVAKYRKVHLADLYVKAGFTYLESARFTAGNEFSIFEVDGHKIGLGVCHDLRFEEMARGYRNAGCEMLIYPSDFADYTGFKYMELLQRSRANDNQLYVVTCAPAFDPTAKHFSFGHSMVVDPWARVQVCAGEDETTVVTDIDFSLVKKVREELPIFGQRRLDLYPKAKEMS
ncbi:omega-amidase NIT2 [Drosophila biarmipes]|uniref:omega-amidase NIT2 n=1 Tax=Drosophila biarmipes TaxID=125945 RepID=UPI0007E60170|nr:omega-amidase NIT2 [Drosophila biarmipes]